MQLSNFCRKQSVGFHRSFIFMKVLLFSVKKCHYFSKKNYFYYRLQILSACYQHAIFYCKAKKKTKLKNVLINLGASIIMNEMELIV